MEEWTGSDKRPDTDMIVQQTMDLMRPYIDAAHREEEDARLRAKYPALQSAWEQYQVILRMCRGGDDPDEE